MNKGDVFSQLRDFLDLLNQNKLVRYSNPVIEVASKLNGKDVLSVTTSRHIASQTGPILDSSDAIDYFFSVNNYASAFRAGDYSVVLQDGSLLQFRYDFLNRGDFVGHRLCYFPMPCTIGEDYLDELDPAELIDMIVEQEPSRIRLRTPLRFDYSRFSQSSEPEVHLHLVSDKGRLPVFGPLSIGHFVTVVFKTFYPTIWNSHEFLRLYRPSLIRRTIERKHEDALHLGCRHD